jgi:osmotically-inducible protein OsmY
LPREAESLAARDQKLGAFDPMATPYPDDDFIPLWPVGDTGGDGADDRLCRMVVDRLRRVPHLVLLPIVISVQNRVVILEGGVDSMESAATVCEEAWSTPGVHDVCNALAIR